jgi:hypothetical protein
MKTQGGAYANKCLVRPGQLLPEFLALSLAGEPGNFRCFGADKNPHRILPIFIAFSWRSR